MQNMGQQADLCVARQSPRIVVTKYPLCGSESSPPEADGRAAVIQSAAARDRCPP
jgi:hypothetical protein